MKKIFVFIIVFLSFINVYAYEFNLKSSNVVMVNLNDENILYEKEANQKVQIASLTKIITAITVLDNAQDLSKFVTITPRMLSGIDGYAKMGLKSGDKITYIELLYAIMLPSAADAAQAIAIDMAGTIDDFAELMNKEVEKIGVSNSHFTNPVGIDDENNYSTAYDLYIILKYALNNPTFKTIFETNEYHIISLDKDIKKTIYTTAFQNNLDISIISGAKTGFTYEAGLCLASETSKNDISYIIINLGAPVDTLNYITDPINLYNYYISNYEFKRIMSKNQLLVTLPIKNGWKKELSFYANQNYDKYVLKSLNQEDIKIEYNGIKEITKDNKKGDKLGTVYFKYNDELLYEQDIYLNEELRYHNYLLIVYFLLSLVIIVIMFKMIRKVRRKKYAKNNKRRSTTGKRTCV